MKRLDGYKFQKSMMIKIILTILFLGFVTVVPAQTTISMDLKPIFQQNGRYFYNMKKLDGGAYGLQVPLQSLGDPEINKRYNTFKALRKAEMVLSFVPIFYLFYIANNHYVNKEEFWTIWGSTLGGIIVLDLIAKNQLHKGIDRYNHLVLEPSGRSIGISLTYKF
jgi:hypothetical protein